MAKKVKDGYIIDDDYYGDIKITKVKDTQEVEPHTKKVSLEKSTDKLIHQNNFRSNRNLKITSISNEHKKIILTKPNDITVKPSQDNANNIPIQSMNVQSNPNHGDEKYKNLYLKLSGVMQKFSNITQKFSNSKHEFLHNNRTIIIVSYIILIILLPFLNINYILIDLLLLFFMPPLFHYIHSKDRPSFLITLVFFGLSILLFPLHVGILDFLNNLTLLLNNFK